MTPLSALLRRIVWVLLAGIAIATIGWIRSDPSQRAYLGNIMGQVKDLPGRYAV